MLCYGPERKQALAAAGSRKKKFLIEFRLFLALRFCVFITYVCHGTVEELGMTNLQLRSWFFLIVPVTDLMTHINIITYIIQSITGWSSVLLLPSSAIVSRIVRPYIQVQYNRTTAWF